MRNLLLVGLASLVLACSSQETRCRELSVELGRTMIKMENTQQPAYLSFFLSGQSYANQEEFKTLQKQYKELKERHYEECNQVQF